MLMIVPHGYKIGPTGLESPAGVSNEIKPTMKIRRNPQLQILPLTQNIFNEKNRQLTRD